MGLIAAMANLTAFGLLLLVEALISRLGRVAPSSPSFRYMRDRNLFRIGDTVGLSLVAFAAGSVLGHAGFPPTWYVLLVVVVALLVTAAMHLVWLRQPVRDSGYPPSGVSLLGILHLPYFAGHVALVLLGLWHITDLSNLGYIVLGVMGGLVWGITLLRDGK